MLSETLAWRAILALDRLLAERAPRPGALAGERFVVTPAHAELAAAGAPGDDALLARAGSDALLVHAGAPPGAWVQAAPDPATRPWRSAAAVDRSAERVLDLYLPMVLAPMRDRPQVIAHLAQSLDGRIATDSGTSQWITGAEDQAHNHRMRALCDAVLVGAETIIHDDPQLTCREVEGSHPLRVIVDPRGRVSMNRRVFKDAAAPTVIITATDAAGGHRDPGDPGDPGNANAPLPAHVSRMEVDSADGRIEPHAILAALASMRVRRVFVEGGGVTVSAFLRDRLLDRLQITVAPMLIGSGRASISLPTIDSLEHALRPRMRRFALGADMMFECVFED